MLVCCQTFQKDFYFYLCITVKGSQKFIELPKRLTSPKWPLLILEHRIFHSVHFGQKRRTRGKKEKEEREKVQEVKGGGCECGGGRGRGGIQQKLKTKIPPSHTQPL